MVTLCYDFASPVVCKLLPNITKKKKTTRFLEYGVSREMNKVQITSERF